jgi:hypothetical protein
MAGDEKDAEKERREEAAASFFQSEYEEFP